MNELVAAGTLVVGGVSSYKTGKILVRELKKRFNRIHAPTWYGINTTGLVVPKNGGKSTLKSNLAHLNTLCIIDLDDIVADIADYNSKVVESKNEIEKLQNIYKKHKRYLVLSSDAQLLKLVGCQRRYTALVSNSFYLKLKKNEEFTENKLYVLLDSMMTIQRETAHINPYRKFVYNSFEELTEVVETLWGTA